LFLVLCLATTAVPAYAMPPRDSDIGRTSARGIQRFCPELAGTTQPDNQRICLRPYRTSLTLKCRQLLKR
jgi:hypothetical protein